MGRRRWRGGITDFDIEHVRARVEEAHQDAAKSFAIAVEAETKVNVQQNDQIDTGFMLNSAYSLWREGSSYEQTNPSGEYRSRRTGSDQERRIARERRLPRDAVAATAVGAEYAIWQELRQSFLFKALVTVASRAKAVLEPAYRRRL